MTTQHDPSLVCPKCGKVTANFRSSDGIREPTLCTKCLMPDDPVYPTPPEYRPPHVDGRSDVRWYKKWGASGES